MSEKAPDSAPPVPLEIDEPEELKIKRWEELLSLVKLGHEQAHQRWDAIEEKTTKYAGLLGVIVAAVAIAAGEVARIVVAGHDNWAELVFMAAYAGVGVFGVAAFGCFLWALRLQTVVEPPLGRDLLSHVASNNYVDVLYSMSVSFVASTEQLNDGVARKTRAAAWGFYGLLAVLVCAIISSVSYVTLKMTEEIMKPNQAQPQSRPASAPAQRAEPSPSSPNPGVAAPPGQAFQKGIEGGTRPSSKPSGTK